MTVNSSGEQVDKFIRTVRNTDVKSLTSDFQLDNPFTKISLRGVNSITVRN